MEILAVYNGGRGPIAVPLDVWAERGPEGCIDGAKPRFVEARTGDPAPRALVPPELRDGALGRALVQLRLRVDPWATWRMPWAGVWWVEGPDGGEPLGALVIASRIEMFWSRFWVVPLADPSLALADGWRNEWARWQFRSAYSGLVSEGVFPAAWVGREPPDGALQWVDMRGLGTFGRRHPVSQGYFAADHDGRRVRHQSSVWTLAVHGPLPARP